MKDTWQIAETGRDICTACRNQLIVVRIVEERERLGLTPLEDPEAYTRS